MYIYSVYMCIEIRFNSKDECSSYKFRKKVKNKVVYK